MHRHTHTPTQAAASPLFLPFMMPILVSSQQQCPSTVPPFSASNQNILCGQYPSMETGHRPEEASTVGYCIQRLACEMWNCYRPVPILASACSFPFLLSEPEGLISGTVRRKSLQGPRSTAADCLKEHNT